MDKLFTYKKPMTCIIYATPNVSKSYECKRYELNAQINVNA